MTPEREKDIRGYIKRGHATNFEARELLAELDRVRDTWAVEAKLNQDENQQLKAENEKLRMQLAACGVAAMCNTVESIKEQGITNDDPYWSASYGDVCDAVGREIKLRENLGVAIEVIKHTKNSLSEIKESDLGMLGLYETLRDVLSKIQGDNK